MRMLLYWGFCLVLSLCMGMVNVHAEESDKEQIENTIGDLQMRLMELEGKLDAMEEKEKVHELEGRVSKMENDLGWVKLEDPHTFRAYWANKPRFETRNGDFKIDLIGRIMNDWTWQTANDPTEKAYEVGLGETTAFEDSTEFRRARIGIQGTIYDRGIFKIEFDHESGDSTFKDVFVGVKKIPFFGAILVGHQKEQFGLETLTSSKHITFMERGYTDVFSPDRNTGINFFNTFFNKRMSFAAGVYRDTDDFGDSCADRPDSCDSGDGNYNWTTRITGLPWYKDKGRKLVHTGLSLTRRSPNEKRVRYRSRPLVHDAIRLADTRTTNTIPSNVINGFYDNPLDAVDKVYNINPELAFVYGPFSLQGEYVWNLNDVKSKQIIIPAMTTADGEYIPAVTKRREDADFRAWYAYASYFLTGEHRQYSPKKAKFDNIKVRDNFYDKKTGYGWGAWETAFRMSELDLDDSGVDGGELTTYNLGLNWYLNYNTRIMANYNFTDVERNILYETGPPANPFLKDFDDGRYHAFTMRFQVHW